MKRILRLPAPPLYTAAALLFLAGCATPPPPGSPDTESLAADFMAEGVPVEIDFDQHLYYGDLEISTAESGAKHIVLNAAENEEQHHTGFFWRLPEPLPPGDGFVLSITGRSLEGGELAFPVMVEIGRDPWTKAAIQTLSFDEQTRTRRIAGVMVDAGEDAPTHINLHLGKLHGTLEIESLELIRLPAPAQE